MMSLVVSILGDVNMTEKEISLAIAAYLKRKYPHLLYRFDLAADLKLTMGQAVQNKRLQMQDRGYPDLFIAEPKKGFHGLYVEIKKSGDEVFKKNGGMRGNKHIMEQWSMLYRLKQKGYRVEWGLGFQDAIKKIDNYLKD